MSERQFSVTRTEEEWRKTLTEAEYHILREAGTEPSFSGQYHDHKAEGQYLCAGCGQPLFDSESKFQSGTGWPSFWAPVDDESVVTRPDTSLFRTRTEVLCSRCGGHLGHVFDDGPEPTGKRYCINSLALDFEPASD